MFSVRTAGQRSHNQVDLELIKQKWGNTVQHVLFEFGTPDPNAPVDPDALKNALRAGAPSSNRDAPIRLDAQPAAEDADKLQQAASPPLSWHLSEKQQNNIESEWTMQAGRSQAQAVGAFLR